MKASRLALPIAALAAALGVSIVHAEENSARLFLNEQAGIPQYNLPDASANTPAANTEETEQQQPPAPRKTVNVASVTNTVAAPAVAPAINAPNGEIIALIDKHAAANGIPASFARAVVRVESNFNPRATGSQREVGLMQIKFETARGIGYAGTREALYEPDTNLQWGMKYLAMSWKLGGSTPCGAVMKYQGGHAVTQPSPASRAYCAKVQAHMASAQ